MTAPGTHLAGTPGNWRRDHGPGICRLSLASTLLAAVAATGISQDDAAARIAGAALTSGGASAFLETLTDTVGGRVTGTRESLAASDLILRTLKPRVTKTPVSRSTRWSRGGRAVRRPANRFPIERAIVVGSYAWVPGTAGAMTAPLVDVGAPPSNDWTPPAERVRGAAVLIDPQKVGTDPSFVMRSIMARRLAAAGAVAMLLPSDKPQRMVYTWPSASTRRGRCR